MTGDETRACCTLEPSVAALMCRSNLLCPGVDLASCYTVPAYDVYTASQRVLSLHQ